MTIIVVARDTELHSNNSGVGGGTPMQTETFRLPSINLWNDSTNNI